MSLTLRSLADTLVLGTLLEKLPDYELIAHWKKGEFHHDLVFKFAEETNLPGSVLVVATNCNAGVKEVIAFDEVPSEGALWHWRCPDVPEFAGDVPKLLGHEKTTHWFPPCDLLAHDARSEIREEFRERIPGGGFRMKS